MRRYKLPSNLRPTSRKCVHLLAYGNVGKRHRYDTWNFPLSCLHAAPPQHNAHAVWAVVVMLWLKHRGCRITWGVFCSCDPMTFIYELDLYYVEMYRMCKYELLVSWLLKAIIWQTDIRTESTKIILPCCFVGGQNSEIQSVDVYCYNVWRLSAEGHSTWLMSNLSLVLWCWLMKLFL